MRIFLLVATFLITIPSLVLACLPIDRPSNSLEPVTIKIADTYFKIPEVYIQHWFWRVPRERGGFIIYVPAKIIFAEQTNPANIVTIRIFPNTDEVSGKTIQLNNSIKIDFGADIPPHEMHLLGDSKVIKYLKSISSKEEPESWKKDTEIAKKFQLGKDPCEDIMRRGSEQNKADTPEINHQDILEGIHHRNESIREAAAYRIAEFYKGNEKNTLEIIQNILSDDKSNYVRSAAVQSLIKIAENNDELIPQIINIMINDKSELVRKTISEGLPKLGTKSVELLIPLIKVGGEENYKNIGNVLAYIIRMEIYNSKYTSYKEMYDNRYTSYKQLSPQSITALNGIINILNNTKDEKTNESLLSTLGNLKSAIATEELVETLSDCLKSHKTVANLI